MRRNPNKPRFKFHLFGVKWRKCDICGQEFRFDGFWKWEWGGMRGFVCWECAMTEREAELKVNKKYNFMPKPKFPPPSPKSRSEEVIFERQRPKSNPPKFRVKSDGEIDWPWFGEENGEVLKDKDDDKWIKGEPPKDGKRYLLKFKAGIICSGKYRSGTIGEPQQDVVAWRCDCCGRFSTPVAYKEL